MHKELKSKLSRVKSELQTARSYLLDVENITESARCIKTATDMIDDILLQAALAEPLIPTKETEQ